MLVQYPFIISVYYAVLEQKQLYSDQHWLWIGAWFTQHMPTLPVWKAPLLASSLAAPDLILLVLYMISMYLFSRYATMPSTDPQQAQTQKLMAWFSPIMLGYFGFQWKWPSAMVLYWFSYNVFTMGQQFYLLKKFHQPLSVLDNEHAITETPQQVQAKPQKQAIAGNGAPRQLGSTKPAKKKKGARR
jgi:membrane protein insertase Oxa1/YidC/SpoIIIJ